MCIRDRDNGDDGGLCHGEDDAGHGGKVACTVDVGGLLKIEMCIRDRHNDIPERQFANVPTVLQHGIYAAVGHFAAQHIVDTLVVEKV